MHELILTVFGCLVIVLFIAEMVRDYEEQCRRERDRILEEAEEAAWAEKKQEEWK